VEGLHEGIDPTTDPRNDPAEQKHFKEIVGSFINYLLDCFKDLQRMERDLDALPEQQKQLLQAVQFHYQKQRLERFRMCAFQNQRVLSLSVQEHFGLFPRQTLPNGQVVPVPLKVSQNNVQKMRATLKSIVREWTAEGREERDRCFGPVLEAVEAFFPAREGRAVLVPGSGLGRLVYELAKRGFQAQGNEFGYHMLLMGDFILNATREADEFNLFPNIHNFSNLHSEEQAFKKVTFPDECPSKLSNLKTWS